MPLFPNPGVPQSTFSYVFNFTQNQDCSSVLLSYQDRLTTNDNGYAFADVDISSLNVVPYFLCEYKNTKLRKTHNFSSMIFNKIYIQDIMSEDWSNVTITELQITDLTHTSANNDSWNESLATSLYSNETWVDSLFVRFTEIVGQVGNWTANKSNYALNSSFNSTQFTINANVTIKETWLDTLYYKISNPSNFWNDTFATFNKTYADTLYQGLGINIFDQSLNTTDNVKFNNTNLTGALTVANLTNAINSGNYPVQMMSNVTSDGSANGYILDTTNNLNTNGDRIFNVKTAGNDKFYVGRDNGAWGTKVAKHLAIGKSTVEIPQFSLLKIEDKMNLANFGQQGDGIDLDVEMAIGGSFITSAAFNGKATVTGAGVLPFVSGMMFEVNQNGTGTWGATPGVWGRSPSVISARWTSEEGAANFGAWASVISIFPPTLASGGGVRSTDGTYIGLEINGGQNTAPYLYGTYIWGQTTTGEATGLMVKKSVGDNASRGIVLDGDGAGADLVLGAGQDTTISYDGNNTIYNITTSGNHSFYGGNLYIDKNLYVNGCIKYNMSGTPQTLGDCI